VDSTASARAAIVAGESIVPPAEAQGTAAVLTPLVMRARATRDFFATFSAFLRAICAVQCAGGRGSERFQCNAKCNTHKKGPPRKRRGRSGWRGSIAVAMGIDRPRLPQRVNAGGEKTLAKKVTQQPAGGSHSLPPPVAFRGGTDIARGRDGGEGSTARAEAAGVFGARAEGAGH